MRPEVRTHIDAMKARMCELDEIARRGEWPYTCNYPDCPHETAFVYQHRDNESKTWQPLCQEHHDFLTRFPEYLFKPIETFRAEIAGNTTDA